MSVFSGKFNKKIKPPATSRPPINLVNLTDYKNAQQQKQQAIGEIVLPCDPAGQSIEPANAHKQEADNWCWAATSQVVLERFDVRDDQCQLVNKALRKDNCCGSNQYLADGSLETPAECDVRGWPHEILNNYGIRPNGVSGYLDWEALTKEICITGAFLPVVKWGRSKGEGLHTIVVKGYRVESPAAPPSDATPSTTQMHPPAENAPRFIQVFDPSFERFYDVLYEAYVGDAPNDPDGPYGYSHEFAYVGISPG